MTKRKKGAAVQIAYDMKREPDGSVSRENVRWQDADGNDIEPVDEGLAHAILAFQQFHSMPKDAGDIDDGE